MSSAAAAKVTVPAAVAPEISKIIFSFFFYRGSSETLGLCN